MKKEDLLMTMEDLKDWAKDTLKCIGFDMKDFEKDEKSETLSFDIWTLQHICEEMLGAVNQYEVDKEIEKEKEE